MPRSPWASSRSIGGEAGAGKSALVDEFTKAAASCTVLVGRCDDLFAPRPLGPLADIAREVGGTLREAIEAGHAAAAFDAFLDLLSDGRRPTIVVLEDLQWADDATLDLLRFVRAATRPCAWSDPRHLPR